MKKFFTKSLLVILLLLSATAFSQRTITGTVADAKTGEKLLGVVVGVRVRPLELTPTHLEIIPLLCLQLQKHLFLVCLVCVPKRLTWVQKMW